MRVMIISLPYNAEYKHVDRNVSPTFLLHNITYKFMVQVENILYRINEARQIDRQVDIDRNIKTDRQTDSIQSSPLSTSK